MSRWLRASPLVAVPLVAALMMGACATVPPAAPPPALPMLSQEDIVRLAGQGVGPEGIIARLKASRTQYRLSTTEVLSLSQRGVPTAVIDYLLDSDRLAIQQDCNARIHQLVRQQDAVCWQQCFMSCPPWPYAYPHQWRRWP